MVLLKINKDVFTNMENAFTKLKTSEGDITAASQLADALHTLTGKNFIVTVVGERNLAKEECVVMSIYPEESTIDAVINAIVLEQNDSIITKVWNETMKWNIEIDRKILTDKANLSEKELTALILHEVGHIVYSNTIPARLSRVVRLEYAKSNLVQKQLLKDTLFGKILSFPILHACNANVNKSNIKTELQADKYAVKAGYGNELKSAMDKVFVLAGSSNSNTDDELKSLYGFSIDSLTALQKRQNSLVRRNFGKMIISTPSKFAKGVITKLNSSLSGNTDINGSVTESVKDEYIHNRIQKITDDFYCSEFFFNRVHKLKRIDPADIDYIGMEVDNIKSNDDKMMIVTYIYNKLDTIDYYLAILDSKNPRYAVPHSRESLISMRNTLEKYKADALARKLPSVSYTVGIQYPAGYEG